MAPPKRRLRTTSAVATRPSPAPASVRGERTRERERPLQPLAVDRAGLLEIGVWGAIALGALGVRLLNLDGAPLQAGESAQAMVAWRVLQRTGLALGAAPLLTYGNVVLFLALGATDAVARALPALAGWLVALSPLALRRQLGRVGAVVAGVTLATSPTLIFASRTVDPTSLSLALAVGLIVVVLRLGETGSPPAVRERYRYAAAALAALLLLSGPLADTLILIFVGYAAYRLWDSGGERRGGSWRSGLAEVVPASPDGWADDERSLVSHWRGPLVAFGLTLAVGATGAGTNLEGLGNALAEPLGAWASSFGGLTPASLVLFPLIALGYEPLGFVFGVVGAVVALRGKRGFGEFLTWWAVLAAALFLIGDGQHPLGAATFVVPLALLTGRAVDGLPSSFRSPEQRTGLLLFAAVVLSLVATTLIAAGNATLPDPNVPRWIVIMPLLAIAAFVVCFGLWYDAAAAVSAGAAVALVVLAGGQIHAAMLLNPGGPLNPAEVFVGKATSPDVRTMAAEVSTVLDELHIARQLEGRPVTENVAILAPYADPIAWYLRGQRFVDVVATVGDAPAVAIVGERDRAPSGPYAGQVFQFSTSAPRPGLSPVDLGRWWLYREVPGQTETYVKVYVKAQLGRR